MTSFSTFIKILQATVLAFFFDHYVQTLSPWLPAGLWVQLQYFSFLKIITLLCPWSSRYTYTLPRIALNSTRMSTVCPSDSVCASLPPGSFPWLSGHLSSTLFSSSFSGSFPALSTSLILCCNCSIIYKDRSLLLHNQMYTNARRSQD